MILRITMSSTVIIIVLSKVESIYYKFRHIKAMSPKGTLRVPCSSIALAIKRKLAQTTWAEGGSDHQITKHARRQNEKISSRSKRSAADRQIGR